VGCVGCVGCVLCVLCGVCGGRGAVGGLGSLLTFDIPQTALVATLDTYDFIFNSTFFMAVTYNCIYSLTSV
jgi:hypothetical protein